ncbi:response regulator transcription factor [Streptomyces sp. AK02-01A]|uniref:response regulator transcription factor n=1 Tax=Streptomyces sp. AK02-01A TaxID=3028648 RepID=UPI0029B8601E|nr:response regulator transcription factor [Streptomyces sp. AK02-01A]MDX3853951.1 response regulator transcription factor [Streptomyces sp. AK02-01A]
MELLTDVVDPGAARGRRQPGRRQPRTPLRQTGAEALHNEIDNPLDLIAGHQLLADPEDRRPDRSARARLNRASAGCACGHPLCTESAHGRASATRLFLVERHPVASAGLRSVLGPVPDMVVVGSSGDAGRALEAVRRVRPDVILLGGGDTLGDDLSAVARLRGQEGAAGVRILLLRRAESTTEASRMLLAGASGCFPLDLAEDRIIGAVSMVAAGGTVFLPAPPPARVHPAGLDRHATEPLPQNCGLTGREREVLAQLARGLSNAEIGRELALAEATVKKHLTQAMRKTGQPDRLRAALYAHRHGLAG